MDNCHKCCQEKKNGSAVRETRGADFRPADQERALGWQRLDEMER